MARATLRGTSLEDSLMGVGRGERNYVLGMRNIFQLKRAKQEHEAKFGTREREEEMKERGHASGLQERAPSSAYNITLH